MTKTAEASRMKATPPAKSRMRQEIVDAMRGLEKAGALSGEDLEKTTLRMLGKDAMPKVEAMSPAEIAAMRARVGISQAVLAGFMNVAVNTVSQWERGERQPTGAALKLLNVASITASTPCDDGLGRAHARCVEGIILAVLANPPGILGESDSLTG